MAHENSPTVINLKRKIPAHSRHEKKALEDRAHPSFACTKPHGPQTVFIQTEQI